MPTETEQAAPQFSNPSPKRMPRRKEGVCLQEDRDKTTYNCASETAQWASKASAIQACWPELILGTEIKTELTP